MWIRDDVVAHRGTDSRWRTAYVDCGGASFEWPVSFAGAASASGAPEYVASWRLGLGTCTAESYHHPSGNGVHKTAAGFEPKLEPKWLRTLYAKKDKPVLFQSGRPSMDWGVLPIGARRRLLNHCHDMLDEGCPE